MRLALTIEYEGTSYHGFQYQADLPSIQGELELAIEQLTGEHVRVNGAGRTDAAVHAKAQVVAFDSVSSHSPQTFVSALNHYLPCDIAVREAYTVRSDFDPRRQALSRTYRYTILSSNTPSPLARRFSCRISGKLDIARMKEGAALFIGEHDFKQFAAPLPAGRTNSTRAIMQASVKQSGDVIEVWFTGNAFLQHQVRRMSGALVDIGRGRLSIKDLKTLIDNEETDRVANSLPAHGLCLMRIEYADYPPQN